MIVKQRAAMIAAVCGLVSVSYALSSVAATCTDNRGHKYQCSAKPIVINTPPKAQPKPAPARPATPPKTTMPVVSAGSSLQTASKPVLAQQPRTPAKPLVDTSRAGNGIVAQGAGNIVAQGAGNIVAQGAGNAASRPAASIISTNGGGLRRPGGM